MTTKLDYVPSTSMASSTMAHDTPLDGFVHSLAADCEGPRGDPNIIWMFWHSGFDDAPDVVRRSLETWRHFNPDHDLRALSLADASKLLELDLEAAFDEVSIDLAWAGKSDLIRLMLLSKFGGVWVDATTFCLKPLSDWLYDEMTDIGFFSFRSVKPSRSHELISWFMAARAGNPIIRQTLLESIHTLFKKRLKKLRVSGYQEFRAEYGLREGDLPGRGFLEKCENNHESYPYFWMFYIFRDVIREVPKAYNIWMSQSNRFAQGKHDMNRFARSFVSKQTYKVKYQQTQLYADRLGALFDGEKIRENYTVSELSGPNSPYQWHDLRRSLQISEARKIIFIHIPKCGGTSIDSSNLFEDGMRRFGHLPLGRYRKILGPRISDFRILTTVRNPWDRLGSAFFFASLESTKFKNADADIARDLHAEFGVDFQRFLAAFVAEPTRFLSMLWFKPSVWFFNPKSCKLPSFVQKLEEIQDIGPLREFVGFEGLEIPHRRKGPMRQGSAGAFTPELFSAVGQIYREDVEVFDYGATTIDDLSY